MQQRKKGFPTPRLSGRFMSWVEDLLFNPPECCFDVGSWLGLVLALHSVFFLTWLWPLWPVSEKQCIRNSTFYISVNDF